MHLLVGLKRWEVVRVVPVIKRAMVISCKVILKPFIQHLKVVGVHFFLNFIDIFRVDLGFCSQLAIHNTIDSISVDSREAPTELSTYLR